MCVCLKVFPFGVGLVSYRARPSPKMLHILRDEGEGECLHSEVVSPFCVGFLHMSE